MKYFILLFTALCACLFLYGLKTSVNTKATMQNELRAVTIAPSYCETINDLNASIFLVGVTRYCEANAAKNIAKIGGFADPNLEAILSLKPSIIFGVPHPANTDIVKFLQNKNIKTYFQKPDSLSQIIKITKDVGDIFNKQQEADQLIKTLQNTLANTKTTFKNFKGKNFSFLYIISWQPLVVAGQNTFISEILTDTFYLQNDAHKSNDDWPIWSVEHIMTNTPDILFLSSDILAAEFKKLSVPKKTIVINSQGLLKMPSIKALEKDINSISKLIINSKINGI